MQVSAKEKEVFVMLQIAVSKQVLFNYSYLTSTSIHCFTHIWPKKLNNMFLRLFFRIDVGAWLLICYLFE